MRAKANPGMVQIFSTFGLAIVMRGLGAVLLHARLSQHHALMARRQDGNRSAASSCRSRSWSARWSSIAAFGGLYLFINRTDFGRALEATREDPGAVALVGIDKNRVFALGWGLGARAGRRLPARSWRCFFYIYPDVGASFALIAYVTVALGGFGSVFGAFAGGIVVGLVEADHRAGAAAVAEVGRHLRRLSPRRSSSGRAACSDRCDGQEFTAAAPPRPHRRRLPGRGSPALVPLFVKNVYVQNIMILTLMFGALSQSWNILSRLLRADLARACALFRHGRLYHHAPVHQVRRAALVRHARRRRHLGADRDGARLSLLPPARPLLRRSPPSCIAEIGLLLFHNWDWAGAALGIQDARCAATAG